MLVAFQQKAKELISLANSYFDWSKVIWSCKLADSIQFRQPRKDLGQIVYIRTFLGWVEGVDEEWDVGWKEAGPVCQHRLLLFLSKVL
jgi:hypothetical protein